MGLGLLCGLIIAAGYGLLYTNHGARFVMHQLLARADVQMESATIKGTFAGGVQLEEVVLHHHALSLVLDAADIDISLEGFYPLRVVVNPLHLRGLLLQLPDAEILPPQDARQPLSFDFNLPVLDPFFDNIDIRIVDFSLFDARIEQNEQPVFELAELHSTVQFSHRILTLDLPQFVMPELHLTGSLELNAVDSGLSLAAIATAADDQVAWERVELDARVAKIDGDVNGFVTVRLSLPEMEPVTAQTVLILQGERLDITTLTVSQQGRDGSITARGSLSGTSDDPQLDMVFEFHELDLEAEAGMSVNLSGALALSYSQQQYQGTFDLQGEGSDLVSGAVAGLFSGNHQQLQVEDLHGHWMEAQISGKFQTQWSPQLQVVAEVTALGVEAKHFDPQIDALLNARLQGTYSVIVGEHQAALDIDLFDSLLHGFPLSASAQLHYQDNDLIIEALNLYSDELEMHAQGKLTERINYQLRADDISKLYPDVAGRLESAGWLRFSDDLLQGQVGLEGMTLKYKQWSLDRLDAVLDVEQAVFLKLTGKGLRQGEEHELVEHFHLSGSGLVDQHQAQLQVVAEPGTLALDVRGGWVDSVWNGELTRLVVDITDMDRWQQDGTTDLIVSTELLKASRLNLVSVTGQRVQVEGFYQPLEDDYRVDLHWDHLSLAMLDLLTTDHPLRGNSSGSVTVLQQDDDREMTAVIRLMADVDLQKTPLQDVAAELNVIWNATGLDGSVTLQLDHDAGFVARFMSADAASFELPQQLDFSLQCQALPLTLLSVWLPPDIQLEGKLGCKSHGRWINNEPLSVSGQLSVTDGHARWYDIEQSMDVAIQTAEFRWQWHEEFTSELSLVHDFGHLTASLQLPVAAVWPLDVNDATPFQVSVETNFQENGLLSAFFPQQIQYSRGQIELRAAGRGTVGNPELSGTLALTNTEFYLPAAGIHIGDIRMLASLKNQRIGIDELQLTSGAGTINGQGQLVLDRWMPDHYELSLSGDQFQIFNLSDLMVRISPDLQLTGDLERVTVRGDVQIPYVMVKDQKGRNVIKNSPDLIILDREVSPTISQRLHHDIDVQLILGEQVLIDVAGLEARIEGSIRFFSDSRQDFAAQGLLQVVRGRFSSYGVSLDVERGALYYTGGPLSQPTLDVLALRQVGQVRAGLRASGTPQEPVVYLYSEPVMPDADILAYIVLGRPLAASGGDTDLLMTAAGALLSQGESIVLQERIRSRFGLDVLDFSAGGGDLSESVITTGKYLTPDLYISLGYSLFTNTNEVKIRYRLSKDIDIESSFGIESGVDLFYQFEFR